ALVGLRCGDRETVPPLVAAGTAVLELLPGRAAVGCLIDRAAWAAAVEAERGADALIRGCVEHIRIARIHDEIGRAGERVDVEHFRPRLSAVGRLEDTTLRIGFP